MAVSPNMPEHVLARLRGLAEGGARGLAGRSAAISSAYRARKASATAVQQSDDALAYALARAPATYAAVAFVLNEIADRLPDWAPRSTLDLGAGPGTASWALAEAWPSLSAMALVDHNPQFLDLARRMAAESAGPLGTARIEAGELTRLSVPEPGADLVMASYALTELADESLLAVARDLWRASAGLLVIVEPGRPRDYRRLMAIRADLLGQGASMVAPCPHARACPMAEPDWCHFAVRLARSREHRALKGADMGYEDEKFSYLVLARPHLAPAHLPARILRPPETNKFSVQLALCTARGLETHTVLKRDAPAFRAARKRDWGDALEAR